MKNKIIESEWPTFANKSPAFLDKLNNIADKAYDEKSVVGYLASLLIYQQLVEELIKFIIFHSDFFIKAKIYPIKINQNKHEGKMFGDLLQEFNRTIEFKQKQKILEKCKRMNSIRIQGVHNVTKQKNLKTIKKNVADVKKVYLEILFLCEKAHSDLLDLISNIK